MNRFIFKALWVIGSFIVLSFAVNAQTRTFLNSNGNWDATGSWQSANIADAITEDVAFATGSTVTATVRNTYSYTVGNIALDKHKITVNNGGTLNVGQSGTAKSVTASNNGAAIQVDAGGNMIIWGDLIVDNSFVLTVTGRLEIKGNVTMNNGGSLSVSGGGDVIVGGSLSGGQNTNISVSGSGSTIQVTGPITVGGGSSSISAGSGGSISASGCTCSGCSGGTNCTGNVTPVTLLYFASSKDGSLVKLNWATATELNFDYFDVQRASTDLNFLSIGKVEGNGTTTTRHDYSFTDELPLIGKNYYRLRSIDFDGFTETFEIVAVDFESEKQFILSPNPSDGLSISAQVNFTPRENALVMVYDNVGSMVGKFQLNSANSAFNFSERLKPGIYFAKFSSDDFSKVSRFLVKE